MCELVVGNDAVAFEGDVGGQCLTVWQIAIMYEQLWHESAIVQWCMSLSMYNSSNLRFT